MNGIDGKRALILVENEYEDLEAWYPKLRLTEEGVKVVTAGTGQKSYKGKHGYPIEVDGSIKDFKAEDFDVVIVVGGWAADRLRRFKEVNDFVRDAFSKGKIVAAICHGPSVLISANILKGKKITCFSAIIDDVVNAGATYMDKPVVVDKNLITSRVPNDLPEFCKAIIKSLR